LGDGSGRQPTVWKEGEQRERSELGLNESTSQLHKKGPGTAATIGTQARGALADLFAVPPVGTGRLGNEPAWPRCGAGRGRGAAAAGRPGATRGGGALPVGNGPARGRVSPQREAWAWAADRRRACRLGWGARSGDRGVAGRGRSAAGARRGRPAPRGGGGGGGRRSGAYSSWPRGATGGPWGGASGAGRAGGGAGGAGRRRGGAASPRACG